MTLFVVLPKFSMSIVFNLCWDTCVRGQTRVFFGKKAVGNNIQPRPSLVFLSTNFHSNRDKEHWIDTLLKGTENIILNYESWCYNIVPVWQSMKTILSNNHLR